MKITVIGGTGLIGSQVVQKLTAAGHQAVPAALSTGLDLITGKGLDQALERAEVVVNVGNSPTFDEDSLDFFRTSMNNLLAAGESAGARHQVILSIVGVDQVPQLDYYRARTLQEDLLRQGPTPYSIVRATQFFEFMNTLVSETSDDTTVRLPSTSLQPIAAADVADAVARVSIGPPLRGIRKRGAAMAGRMGAAPVGPGLPRLTPGAFACRAVRRPALRGLPVRRRHSSWRTWAAASASDRILPSAEGRGRYLNPVRRWSGGRPSSEEIPSRPRSAGGRGALA
jgi:uncharacterized protein YbjT (DUF2867 family)